MLPEQSMYNGQPAWTFCVDDVLFEQGEVCVYQAGDYEPIAVVANYEEAILICNAVNRFRDGHRYDFEQFKLDHAAGKFPNTYLKLV